MARVISVEHTEELLDNVTFKVSSVLKGDQTDERTLQHNRGLGCEYSPRVGVVYLFFGKKNDDGSYSIRGVSGHDLDVVLKQLPAPIWKTGDRSPN